MSACGGAGDDLGFGGEQFGFGDAAVDASEDAIHCRGAVQSRRESMVVSGICR